ncbi:MAG: GC-type dockerin domain-anchored protein [Planctomycetota bacterium]|nr:GC-type dockerin domain-anchored protein [Planctomycetota bacterium]
MSQIPVACRFGASVVKCVLVAGSLCSIHAALAVDASFQGIGDLAGGTNFSEAYAISSDGSSVVGYSSSTAGFQAYRWRNAGGIFGLGDLAGGSFSSIALGTNANGDVVVGKGLGNSGNEAFRYEAGTMLALGGTIAGGVLGSQANACSANGNIVVGARELAGFQREACRWVKSGSTYTLSGIGDLPGGQTFSIANACSNDGSVIVGSGSTDSTSEAFRWVLGQGMTSLGTLPLGTPPGTTGGSFSEANACNSTGSVVVGYSSDGTDTVAFVWSADTGALSPLGDFAGGALDSNALGVSADGRIIVGYGTSAAGQDAMIWSSRQGMRSIRTLLVNAGVNLNGWILRQATGISADGTTICGIGINPSGNSDAWIATLPRPCDADFNEDGFLDFTDFDAFVVAFEAGAAIADFNSDGFLDFTDFDAFVASFEAGC